MLECLPLSVEKIVRRYGFALRNRLHACRGRERRNIDYLGFRKVCAGPPVSVHITGTAEAIETTVMPDGCRSGLFGHLIHPSTDIIGILHRGPPLYSEGPTL